MAIFTTRKIKEMNEKELNGKIMELRLELFKEVGHAEVSGSVKNPGRIKEIKRTIARIKTYQRSKEGKKRKK